MKLMFLGPPGAGKGTMAAKLAVELAIPHISTGDIIRAAIRDATPLGLEVKAIVEAGKLVSDDLTNQLVKERLSRPDTARGFILDGYPRTIPQAKALAGLVVLDRVINFAVPAEKLIARLSGRRVHKASGRTYHVLYSPPKVAGKDDLTGEDLWQRPDDSEESVRTRLQVYEEQTAPLIQFYSQQDHLDNLDASPDTEKVFSDLKRLLQLVG